MNPAIFLRQLRYWTFHCLINALPSFILATVYLQIWRSPSAVAAMMAAVATFILLYATVTSLSRPLRNEDHLLSRALKIGTRIRLAISGVSTVYLPFLPLVLFMPDMWCGVLAIGTLNRLASMVTGSGRAFFDFSDGGTIVANGTHFLATYAVTMLEGFILSFLLLLISFIAVICLQAKDRRRANLELYLQRLNQG